jgi:hypothetical protein
MSRKLLLKLYKWNVKYIKSRLGNKDNDQEKVKEQNKFCLLQKEVHYDKRNNTYYFKIFTSTGFHMREVTVDQLFKDYEMLFGLDKYSLAYVHYIAGKLENLANKGQNSLYTFHAISPFDQSIFIVKSLINMSTEEWNIFDAFNKESYLNLDKPSIARFFELYYIAKDKCTKDNQTTLHLVK